MRKRDRLFSRIVRATYASIAKSSKYVNGSLAPIITFGEATGTAREYFRISQTDIFPYAPGTGQSVPALLERRYSVRLSAEPGKEPAFGKPRPLTEEETASFEPYGGPQYEVVLSGKKHTVSTEYAIRENEEGLYMRRSQSDVLGDNISTPLVADEDAVRLVELNRVLHTVISTWQ